MKSESHRTIQILEIVGNAIVGGVEKQVYSLVQNMPRLGFQFTCLAPYESAYTASLRELGAEVFVTEMHVNPPWRSLQFAAELIQQQRIDLVHTHLPRAHLLGGLAGRLTNRPVVSTFHGMEIQMEELSLSRLAGNHLLTVCQQAYSQMLALGVSQRNVSLIENGVDLKQFIPSQGGEAFRLEHGIPAQAPLVGFAGRLSFEKGPDQFLNLARVVHAKRPDVHFVLVGEGPMAEELNQFIAENQLTEVVHMVGLGEHMQEIYPAFDVMAVTSRLEGMPLALLESMACGVPTAAMAVGGLYEIIEVGTTGLTAAVEDVNGLAQALLALLDNPEKMKKMGIAARKRVEEKFDLHDSLLRTSQLFHSLLAYNAPASLLLDPNLSLQPVEKPKDYPKPADSKKS